MRVSGFVVAAVVGLIITVFSCSNEEDILSPNAAAVVGSGVPSGPSGGPNGWCCADDLGCCALDTADECCWPEGETERCCLAEPEDNTVQVCHSAPGDRGNRKVIDVSERAYQAHSAHGDTLVGDEICDGVDNDCDGEVDEDDVCSCSCFTQEDLDALDWPATSCSDTSFSTSVYKGTSFSVTVRSGGLCTFNSRADDKWVSVRLTSFVETKTCRDLLRGAQDEHCP